MATITLAQAASNLQSKLKSLAAEVRQSAVDESAAGYGPDLDDALRRMAVDGVDDLSTSAQIAAFLILARYYALVRFQSLLATRVDTEGYAVDGDRQTIFDNVADLRQHAAREAALYGFVVEAEDSQVGIGNDPVDQSGNSSAWARGFLPTDYIGLPPVGYPLEIG